MIWKEEDLNKRTFFYGDNTYNVSKIIKIKANVDILQINYLRSTCEINDVILYCSVEGGGGGDDKCWKLLNFKVLFQDHFKVAFEVFNSSIKYQYIKIYSSNSGNIKSIDIFYRNIPALALVHCRSGWGDRLIGFLNALYFEKKLGFKFGFIWRELHSKDVFIPSADKIFDNSFLKERCYADILKEPYAMLNKNSIQEYLNPPFQEYWGYFIFHKKLEFSDMDSDYTKEYPALWKKIKFKKEIVELFEKIKNVYRSLGLPCTSLHIRSGDILSIPHYKDAFIKASATEIVCSAIKVLLRNTNNYILLFGEDQHQINFLKNYLKADRVIIARDILPSICKENRYFQDLSELILMSCTNSIYSNIDSGYSRLASLIGIGKEPNNWFDLFDLKEQHDIIANEFKYMEVSNNQKALSLYMLFDLHYKLYPNDYIGLLEIAKEILLYSKHTMGVILYVHCLLNLELYNEADKTIGDIILEDFLKILFCCRDSKLIIDAYMIRRYKLLPYPNLSILILNILERKKYNLEDFYKRVIMKHFDNYNVIKFSERLPFFKKNSIKLSSIFYSSAKLAIQRDVYYRLGKILIRWRKYHIFNIVWLFRMIKCIFMDNKKKELFVDKLKEYDGLRIPQLNDYKDYRDSLKIKKYFSYQLGYMFMQAHKAWYKGGYVRLWFEVRKLKKDFNNKKDLNG